MADGGKAAPAATVTAAAPGGGGEAVSADPAELTRQVQELLTHMQTRFQAMSTAIITRIDDMGSRIEELEKNINELMATTATSGGGGGGGGGGAGSGDGGAAAAPGSA